MAFAFNALISLERDIFFHQMKRKYYALLAIAFYPLAVVYLLYYLRYFDIGLFLSLMTVGITFAIYAVRPIFTRPRYVGRSFYIIVLLIGVSGFLILQRFMRVLGL
jgi:hypothetical protein